MRAQDMSGLIVHSTDHTGRGPVAPGYQAALIVRPPSGIRFWPF